jgi:hypothetical protein
MQRSDPRPGQTRPDSCIHRRIHHLNAKSPRRRLQLNRPVSCAAGIVRRPGAIRRAPGRMRRPPGTLQLGWEAAIPEARASARVSIYSRMWVTLPSLTVRAKTKSSSNVWFVALIFPVL